MKRTICFILSLVFIFSFAGCKENKKEEEHPTLETEASGVDIVKYAQSGKIPEIEYSLGDDVEEIEEKLSENDTEGIYQVMEGDVYTTIVTPESVNLVYETENKENGIKYIVSMGKSYGFDNGVDPNTVGQVMEKKGYDSKLVPIPSDVAQFVPASTNCDCLTYTISGYSVNFVFDSNYLAATVLYKKG